jgi:hypothetical protein
VSVDEWDERVLCPNGACNGLIGREGTCKVCGHVMPNWGDERMRGLSDEPEAEAEAEDDEDLEDEDESEGDDEGDDAEVSAGAEAPPEWEERKLCDDGACVGVIADNGLCTVCGKRSAA